MEEEIFHDTSVLYNLNVGHKHCRWCCKCKCLSDARVNFQKEEGKKKRSINVNGGCDEAKAFAGEWPYLHSIVLLQSQV